MEKLFNVAGFTFKVTMDDAHPLWWMMSNYEPFLTVKEPVLFSLDVDGEMELPEGLPYYDEDSEREDMPRVTVYRNGDSWAFSMKPTEAQPSAFLLESAPDCRSAVLRLRSDGKFQKFALDNSLMLLFTLNTTGLDTLTMHSSVIAHDGMGYMFLGTSGTGKSTHSSLWLGNIPRCELLNDDNPVVRIMPDGTALVFGSPWSGKTPCYKNERVPIGGIALIRRCGHNELGRLSIPEAYAALLMSCSEMRFSESLMDQLTSAQEKLLGLVPVYVMDCLPDPDAAVVSHDGMCKTCKI